MVRAGARPRTSRGGLLMSVRGAAGRSAVLSLFLLLPLVPAPAQPARPAAADDEPTAFANRGAPLQQEAGEVWQVALSPDGKTLAAAHGMAGDNRPGELKLWDLATGQARSLFRAPQPVRCVAFSPDGKTVAAGVFDHTIRLF